MAWGSSIRRNDVGQICLMIAARVIEPVDIAARGGLVAAFGRGGSAGYFTVHDTFKNDVAFNRINGDVHLAAGKFLDVPADAVLSFVAAACQYENGNERQDNA